MLTRASLYRHPIHPMVIVLPLGLWVFSVVCYLTYLLSAVAVWEAVALYAMAGGIIGGGLAAIPGLIDFVTLPKSRVQSIAISHLISNVIALTIFAIAFLLAVFGAPGSVAPFILSIFGLAAAITGGWFGGELVYVHGVGVSGTGSADVRQGEKQEAEYQHA
jgi:uncharacterized membrane protein